MAKSNNIAALKGLTPSSPKKKHHYVLAKDEEDFAKFSGTKPYAINLSDQETLTYKTVHGSITDKYVYIYLHEIYQIRGLRNIEVSITDDFNACLTLKEYERLKKEIQICNFVSNDHFNPEHIPSVLKEIMAEIGEYKSSNPLRYPCVGMVVKSKREWLGRVKKGETGIIVSLKGMQQNDSVILFSIGTCHDFTNNEMLNDLEFSHLSTHEHIKKYSYTNFTQLNKDFEFGDFDAEFYNLGD